MSSRSGFRLLPTHVFLLLIHLLHVHSAPSSSHIPEYLTPLGPHWARMLFPSDNDETFWRQSRAADDYKSDDDEYDDDGVPCKLVDPRTMVDDLANLSLWELLDTTENQLQLGTATDVVLLLGNTGSGKTTLTQLLVGNASALEVRRLKQEYGQGPVVIVDPGAKIGVTTSSRTIIPEFVANPDSSLAIYDCPGFMDNRGSNTDIAVNFLLNKVTNHVTSVKLVFAAIYPAVNLSADKSNYNMLATSAVKFIKDFSKLDKGIGLIITKAPLRAAFGNKKLSNKEIINNARGFLSTYIKDQEILAGTAETTESEEVIKGRIEFSKILLQDGRIWVMREPSECGPLLNSQGQMKNRMNLLNFINQNLTHVRTTGGDFGYALEEGSLRQIEGSSLTINDKIIEASKKLVDKLRKEQITKIMEIKDYLKVKDFLAVEYKDFHGVLEFLGETKESTPPQVADEIRSVISLRGYNPTGGLPFQDELNKLGGYLSFFDTIAQSSTAVVKKDLKAWLEPFTFWVDEEIAKRSEWYNYLYKVDKQLGTYQFQGNKPATEVPEVVGPNFVSGLTTLAEADERVKAIYSSSLLNHNDKQVLKEIVQQALSQPKISCTDKEFSISGVYVKSSDFTNPDGTYSSCSTTRIAKIFASKKFFIDRHIAPENKKNAQEIFIAAHTWEVVTLSATHINLNGHTGNHPNPLKASAGAGNGVVGLAGEPGKPGYSGGNFYGLAAKIVNPEKLKISADGGKGGDGQAGGDGSEGQRGRDIAYKEWPACGAFEGSGRYDRIRKYFESADMTGKIWPIIFYVMKYGDKGTPGGSGGDGGIGGKGGLPGSIQLHLLEQESSIVSELNAGPVGSSGGGGNGGLGGYTGDGEQGNLWYAGAYCGYRDRIELKGWQRASTGSTGQAGRNTDSQNIPTENQFSLVPSTALNEYKAFLISEESTTLRNPFIRTLEGNPAVQKLYTPTAFAQELLSLDQNLLAAQKAGNRDTAATILQPRYQSITSRIDAFISSDATELLPAPSRKILAIVYTSALSQLTRLKKTNGASVLVDIEKYLSSMNSKFENFATLHAAAVVEDEREEYSQTFNTKIEQALYFIYERVNPTLDDIVIEVKETTNKLQSSVQELVKNTKDKEAAAKIAHQRMKESMLTRRIFTVLQVGAAAVSLLGPQGAAVGAVIGTASTIGKSLMLSENTQKGPEIKLPDAVKTIAGKVEDHLKKPREEKIKELDPLIEATTKAVQESQESFGDLQPKLDSLAKLRDEFEKKKGEAGFTPGDYLDLQDKIEKEKRSLLKDIDEKETTFKEAEKNLETPESEKKKAQTAIKRIETVKKVVLVTAEAGIEAYNTVKADDAQLDQLASIVEKAKKEVEEITKYQDAIPNTLEPVSLSISQDLVSMRNNLAGKSSISLLVQKWQVKSQLADYKYFLAEFTQGFPEAKKFSHVVDKLTEAITLTIDLYDNIEKYGEHMRFADYMANIVSPDALKIEVGPEAEYYISQIQLSIQATVLLGEYDRFTQTFKQFVFPFASSYQSLMDTRTIPDYLDVTKEISTPEGIINILMPFVKTKLSMITDQLVEYKSSVVPTDAYLLAGDFISNTVSSFPFYEWKPNSEAAADTQGFIKDLLMGKPGTLDPSPEYSYSRGRSAVKMRLIELEFTIKNNETRNQEFSQILKQFHLQMTHSGVSHYIYEDQAYTMVGHQVALRYSFERNEKNGERIFMSDSYKKMLKGDFVMSPFTLWTVHLIKADPSAPDRWDELVEFMDEVEVSLEGFGTYVDERRGGGGGGGGGSEGGEGLQLEPQAAAVSQDYFSFLDSSSNPFPDMEFQPGFFLH